jgi:hypothetical protein
MKIKLLLISALSLFFTEKTSAQAFSQNSSYANIGYGIGNLTQSLFKVGEQNDYQYKYNGIGPLFFKYEYAIDDKMGVGVNIAYAKAQATYQYNNTYITNSNTTLLKETLDWTSYSVLLRFNLHFGDNEKVDPYWGIAAGYRDAIWSGSNNDPQNNYDTGVLTTPINIGFETTFGCRFLFTDNIGAYIEVGLAKAVLQFGLTAKF